MSTPNPNLDIQRSVAKEAHSELDVSLPNLLADDIVRVVAIEAAQRRAAATTSGFGRRWLNRLRRKCQESWDDIDTVAAAECRVPAI